MTIGEQTVSGLRGGLPHGGQLKDRRLDAEEASAPASSPLPSLPLTAAEAADLRAGHRRLQPADRLHGPRSTSRSPSRCAARPTAPPADPGVPGHP